MIKKLPIVQGVISLLYIVFNFKKIGAAFQSDIWSKEIDLINHVTNYSIQIQVISIILITMLMIIIVAYFQKLQLSKYLMGVAILLTVILFINTQIDLIRWIEINVFGAGGLLLLTVLLFINLTWKWFKGRSVTI